MLNRIVNELIKIFGKNVLEEWIPLHKLQLKSFTDPEIILENVQVPKKLFDLPSLPFAHVHSNIRKVAIKCPWKALFKGDHGKTISIKAEEVVLVLRMKHLDEWSLDKLIKKNDQYKQKLIKQFEASLKTFGANMQQGCRKCRIINSIRVEIPNLDITIVDDIMGPPKSLNFKIPHLYGGGMNPHDLSLNDTERQGIIESQLIACWFTCDGVSVWYSQYSLDDLVVPSAFNSAPEHDDASEWDPEPSRYHIYNEEQDYDSSDWFSESEVEESLDQTNSNICGIGACTIVDLNTETVEEPMNERDTRLMQLLNSPKISFNVAPQERLKVDIVYKYWNVAALNLIMGAHLEPCKHLYINVNAGRNFISNTKLHAPKLDGMDVYKPYNLVLVNDAIDLVYNIIRYMQIKSSFGTAALSQYIPSVDECLEYMKMGGQDPEFEQRVPIHILAHLKKHQAYSTWESRATCCDGTSVADVKEAIYATRWFTRDSAFSIAFPNSTWNLVPNIDAGQEPTLETIPSLVLQWGGFLFSSRSKFKRSSVLFHVSRPIIRVGNCTLSIRRSSFAAKITLEPMQEKDEMICYPQELFKDAGNFWSNYPKYDLDSTEYTVSLSIQGHTNDVKHLDLVLPNLILELGVLEHALETLPHFFRNLILVETLNEACKKLKVGNDQVATLVRQYLGSTSRTLVRILVNDLKINTGLYTPSQSMQNDKHVPVPRHYMKNLLEQQHSALQDWNYCHDIQDFLKTQKNNKGMLTLDEFLHSLKTPIPLDESLELKSTQNSPRKMSRATTRPERLQPYPLELPMHASTLPANGAKLSLDETCTTSQVPLDIILEYIWRIRAWKRNTTQRTSGMGFEIATVKSCTILYDTQEKCIVVSLEKALVDKSIVVENLQFIKGSLWLHLVSKSIELDSIPMLIDLALAVKNAHVIFQGIKTFMNLLDGIKKLTNMPILTKERHAPQYDDSNIGQYLQSDHFPLEDPCGPFAKLLECSSITLERNVLRQWFAQVESLQVALGAKFNLKLEAIRAQLVSAIHKQNVNIQVAKVKIYQDNLDGCMPMDTPENIHAPGAGTSFTESKPCLAVECTRAIPQNNIQVAIDTSGMSLAFNQELLHQLKQVYHLIKPKLGAFTHTSEAKESSEIKEIRANLSICDLCLNYGNLGLCIDALVQIEKGDGVHASIPRMHCSLLQDAITNICTLALLNLTLEANGLDQVPFTSHVPFGFSGPRSSILNDLLETQDLEAELENSAPKNKIFKIRWSIPHLVLWGIDEATPGKDNVNNEITLQELLAENWLNALTTILIPRSKRNETQLLVPIVETRFQQHARLEALRDNCNLSSEWIQAINVILEQCLDAEKQKETTLGICLEHVIYKDDECLIIDTLLDLGDLVFTLNNRCLGNIIDTLKGIKGSPGSVEKESLPMICRARVNLSRVHLSCPLDLNKASIPVSKLPTQYIKTGSKVSQWPIGNFEILALSGKSKCCSLEINSWFECLMQKKTSVDLLTRLETLHVSELLSWAIDQATLHLSYYKLGSIICQSLKITLHGNPSDNTLNGASGYMCQLEARNLEVDASSTPDRDLVQIKVKELDIIDAMGHYLLRDNSKARIGTIGAIEAVSTPTLESQSSNQIVTTIIVNESKSLMVTLNDCASQVHAETLYQLQALVKSLAIQASSIAKHGGKRIKEKRSRWIVTSHFNWFELWFIPSSVPAVGPRVLGLLTKMRITHESEYTQIIQYLGIGIGRVKEVGDCKLLVDSMDDVLFSRIQNNNVATNESILFETRQAYVCFKKVPNDQLALIVNLGRPRILISLDSILEVLSLVPILVKEYKSRFGKHEQDLYKDSSHVTDFDLLIMHLGRAHQKCKVDLPQIKNGSVTSVARYSSNKHNIPVLNWIDQLCRIGSKFNIYISSSDCTCRMHVGVAGLGLILEIPTLSFTWHSSTGTRCASLVFALYTTNMHSRTAVWQPSSVSVIVANLDSVLSLEIDISGITIEVNSDALRIFSRLKEITRFVSEPNARLAENIRLLNSLDTDIYLRRGRHSGRLDDLIHVPPGCIGEFSATEVFIFIKDPEMQKEDTGTSSLWVHQGKNLLLGNSNNVRNLLNIVDEHNVNKQFDEIEFIKVLEDLVLLGKYKCQELNTRLYNVNQKNRVILVNSTRLESGNLNVEVGTLIKIENATQVPLVIYHDPKFSLFFSMGKLDPTELKPMTLESGKSSCVPLKWYASSIVPAIVPKHLQNHSSCDPVPFNMLHALLNKPSTWNQGGRVFIKFASYFCFQATVTRVPGSGNQGGFHVKIEPMIKIVNYLPRPVTIAVAVDKYSLDQVNLWDSNITQDVLVTRLMPNESWVLLQGEQSIYLKMLVHGSMLESFPPTTVRPCDGNHTRPGYIPELNHWEYVSLPIHCYLPNVGSTSLIKPLRLHRGNIAAYFNEKVPEKCMMLFKMCKVTLEASRHEIAITWPFKFDNLSQLNLHLNGYLLAPGYRFHGNVTDACNATVSDASGNSKGRLDLTATNVWRNALVLQAQVPNGDETEDDEKGYMLDYDAIHNLVEGARLEDGDNRRRSKVPPDNISRNTTNPNFQSNVELTNDSKSVSFRYNVESSVSFGESLERGETQATNVSSATGGPGCYSSVTLGCTVRFAPFGSSTFKIVTFSNYYTMVNKLPFDVCVRAQVDSPSPSQILDVIVKAGSSEPFHSPFNCAYLIRTDNCACSGKFNLQHANLPHVFQLELTSRTETYTRITNPSLLIQVNVISATFQERHLPYTFNGYCFVFTMATIPQYQILNLTRYKIAYTSPSNIGNVSALFLEDEHDNCLLDANPFDKIGILPPNHLVHYAPGTAPETESVKVALRILQVENCEWHVQQTIVTREVVKLDFKNGASAPPQTCFVGVMIGCNGTRILVLSESKALARELCGLKSDAQLEETTRLTLKIPRITLTLASQNKIILAFHLNSLESTLKLLAVQTETDSQMIESLLQIKSIHVDHFVQGFIPVILKSSLNRESSESFLHAKIACSNFMFYTVPVFDAIHIKMAPLAINIEMRVVEQLFDSIERMFPTHVATLASTSLPKPSFPEPKWIEMRPASPMYIRKLTIEPICLILAIRTSEVKLSRYYLQILDALPLDTPCVSVHFGAERRTCVMQNPLELGHSLLHSYRRQLIRQSLPSAWLSNSFAALSGLYKGASLLVTQPLITATKFKNTFEGFILGIGRGLMLLILYIAGGCFQTLGHVLNILHKIVGYQRPKPLGILDAIWLGLNGLTLGVLVVPWKRLIVDYKNSRGRDDHRFKTGLICTVNLIKAVLSPLFGLVDGAITIVEGFSNVLLGDLEKFTHVYESEQLQTSAPTTQQEPLHQPSAQTFVQRPEASLGKMPRPDQKRTHSPPQQDDGHVQAYSARRGDPGSQGPIGQPPPESIDKFQKPSIADTKTGGIYIPPFKLARLQKHVASDFGPEHQRQEWNTLKRKINAIVNKLTITNIPQLVGEILSCNLIRGRGLFARTWIRAQMASPGFTHIYASFLAIVNSKFPEIGLLVLNRVILQFRRAYKRNDRLVCIACTKCLAHLVNQRVAHEIMALQLLAILLERPTDDSVEVAVDFLSQVGAHLLEVCKDGLEAVFDRLWHILSTGGVEKKTQYSIEKIWELRRLKFESAPPILPELDLVEIEDQITHDVDLLDLDLKMDEMLNVFTPIGPAEYQQEEEAWAKIQHALLGTGGNGHHHQNNDASNGSDGYQSDSSTSSASSQDSIKDQSGRQAEDYEIQIKDSTEQDLVNLRKTVYLVIMSSLNYQECVHKLLKLNIDEGREIEVCNMLIDCCAMERTFQSFYALQAERLCKLRIQYCQCFQECFARNYHLVHRLETAKLRNVARFFAHLLYSDAIPWSVLQLIQLTEQDTTSSGRIFIKIIMQQLTHYLGIETLARKIHDPEIALHVQGLFPTQDPERIRFSINFFTAIGLAVLVKPLHKLLQDT
ncbi:bifunctional Initiation factor eIF-4 gamma [Babesia duncani]|uniref:Bifunctional Initiation factor eIF-4 gamma n=1 Tax=Babesia duncani TaxID=323732 RepID=A0AAD9UMM8_9APIC|nr:bifunctional Initiation factor eIF-4 gamma [Babesia duncani]